MLSGCPSPLFSVLSLVRILLNPLAPLRLQGGSPRGSQSPWPSHSDVPMSRATTCTTPNQRGDSSTIDQETLPFLQRPADTAACSLPDVCPTCDRTQGARHSPLHRGGGHYFLILAPAPTWLQISRPDHALGPCSLPASWNGEPGLSPPVTLVSWVMPAHAPDRPVLIPRTCECDCIRQEIFFFFLQM